MTPENFAYWLQGFVDLYGNPPTEDQWEVIKERLILSITKELQPDLSHIDLSTFP